ncbi:retron St85 family RNA-directed DNA polymerase [Brevundimonas sp.]|uniref:retron St85 family RNA-directed DNA polymerase n=1 Tax=Brevundimonas sp. TaxID=1871086 RepID=UPI0039E6A158
MIDEISALMEVGPADVARFLYAAPARYKVFDIPKRNGGSRTIAQPSATLKTIQRYLLASKLRAAPVHPAATAYVTGKGIIDNADAHKANRYILKLDFTDFFPSIKVKDWRNYARSGTFTEILIEDSTAYERILFWGDGGFSPKCLSIGAPTSPHVSNMLMYSFDADVSQAASERGVIYTRYADDLTFSANSRAAILDTERHVTQLVRKMRSPNLSFNESKRGLYGPGERRMVTGLIITPERRVSLGRDRKRLISSMVHRASLGQLDVLQLSHLKGQFGFVIAVEATFLDTLRAKYGSSVIDRILEFDPPARVRD